ncbi:MAG: hypothetical protein AAF086_08945 [Planctomycetota bacterium]
MADSPLLFILMLLAGLALLALIFAMSLSAIAGMKQPPPDRSSAPDAEWGVLRTYNTAEAAHLDRAMLEGCGIPTRLANEHTVGTDWMYGIAVGVDLRVPLDQLESAELLLRDARLGDASVDLDAEGWPGGAEDLRCDRCGSAEVYRIRPGVGWALSAVVLLGLPLLRRARYQCDNCGNRRAFSDAADADDANDRRATAL